MRGWNRAERHVRFPGLRDGAHGHLAARELRQHAPPERLGFSQQSARPAVRVVLARRPEDDLPGLDDRPHEGQMEQVHLPGDVKRHVRGC